MRLAGRRPYSPGVESLDQGIVAWASGLHWPVLMPLMRDLSGYHYQLAGLLAIAAGLLARRLAIPVLTVVAIPLAAVADNLLKTAVGRPRPFVADPAIHPLIARPHDSSMPSGHALTAFACSTIVAMLEPRLRWPAYGLAAAIAASRVYLGVHYPSDVVAGAAVGAALGAGLVLGSRCITRLGVLRARQRPC